VDARPGVRHSASGWVQIGSDLVRERIPEQRLSALPFQTVETINESAQDRQRGFLFGPGFREQEWRNRLVWGDKKYVLPSLLAEFAGKVNLIYIDPPFDTGADFSFTATVPDDPGTEGNDSFTFTKEPSIIEHKAYRDTWGPGIESYLQWFYESVALLHELLGEDGSIYVHLDWHVAHYGKLVLDEIFGQENFRNEIVWKRKGGSANPLNRLGTVTDSIFWYSKSAGVVFNPQLDLKSDNAKKYIEERFTYSDFPAFGRGPFERPGCLRPDDGSASRRASRVVQSALSSLSVSPDKIRRSYAAAQPPLMALYQSWQCQDDAEREHVHGSGQSALPEWVERSGPRPRRWFPAESK
jgi:hypothetical protein